MKMKILEAKLHIKFANERRDKNEWKEENGGVLWKRIKKTREERKNRDQNRTTGRYIKTLHKN